MKTLVAIYNHNMPEITDQLFEALKPFESNIYEIVVIDNGSKRSKKSKYTTHFINENSYFGGALNFAFNLVLENKEYDSLLSLNNDIILHGEKFVLELRSIMFDLDYKLLSPCVLQPEQTQCYWKTMHNWGSKKVRDVKWVDFQSPMIHRELIEEIKQFPPKLIYGWGQDVYSGYICNKNNWQVGVVDWLAIIHYSSLTYRSKNSNMGMSDYSKKAEKNMREFFQSEEILDILDEYRKDARFYSVH